MSAKKVVKKESDKKWLERVEKDKLSCPECNSWCKPRKIDLGGMKVQGWKCNKCDYGIISPRDFEKAYNFYKAKQEKKVKIKKRGNSYMVTIPVHIIKSLGIAKEAIAKVSLRDKHTITIKI